VADGLVQVNRGRGMGGGDVFADRGQGPLLPPTHHSRPLIQWVCGVEGEGSDS
jgi:hypothetical protein